MFKYSVYLVFTLTEIRLFKYDLMSNGSIRNGGRARTCDAVINTEMLVTDRSCWAFSFLVHLERAKTSRIAGCMVKLVEDAE